MALQSLGLHAGAVYTLSDTYDGAILAVGSSLPDGLCCELRLDDGEREGSAHSDILAATEEAPLLGDSGANSLRHRGGNGDIEQASGTASYTSHYPTKGEARGTTFRTDMLKFERITAHLANERTWLAWVRTAVTVLTLSFSFLDLVVSLSDTAWYVFVLGCLFVTAVPITYITGWARYTKVKEILNLGNSEMTSNFQRLGIRHQARYFAVVLLITVIGYYIIGYQTAA